MAIRLFGSNEYGTAYRTWLWMVPPTLWGFWYFWRETPGIFSSFVRIDTWNPHLGYYNELAENVGYT